MEQELFTFIQWLMPAGVKTFDWYNNQFETQEEEDGFDVPAVFMEVLPYQTFTVGQQRQRATVQFNLHIGHYLYTRMSKDSKRQSQALAHLQLADEVFAKLQGKNNGTTIGSITRTNVTPDHSFEGYIVHVHSYRTTMYTDAAVNSTVAMDVDTPLSININP